MNCAQSKSGRPSSPGGRLESQPLGQAADGTAPPNRQIPPRPADSEPAMTKRSQENSMCRGNPSWIHRKSPGSEQPQPRARLVSKIPEQNRDQVAAGAISAEAGAGSTTAAAASSTTGSKPWKSSAVTESEDHKQAHEHKRRHEHDDVERLVVSQVHEESHHQGCFDRCNPHHNRNVQSCQNRSWPEQR